jgi:hypothetical protein
MKPRRREPIFGVPIFDHPSVLCFIPVPFFNDAMCACVPQFEMPTKQPSKNMIFLIQIHPMRFVMACLPAVFLKMQPLDDDKSAALAEFAHIYNKQSTKKGIK